MTYQRFDNFSNLLSGLNMASLDRTTSTFWNSRQYNRGGLDRYWRSRASLYDVGEIYLSKGIAAKIVDRPADDAFHNGVVIEGDDDEVMVEEYDRLGVLTVMADCVRWSRLYGGSAILLVAKDGGDFETPLNLDSLDVIEELRVLDITVIKSSERYYSDPVESNYGQLEFYTITPPGGQSFDVHESRMIVMGGEPLPNIIGTRASLPWVGRSVLDGCMNSLARYEQALEWSLRLLERKQQGIYNMSGLAEMLANGDEQLAVKRLNMADQARGILNSIMVDKEDTYTIENLGLDGIDPFITQCQVALSADCNIPIVILFGKSTTGLNSTGSGDLENYYGMVGHIEEVIARPTLEKLTSVLWMQTALKGKIPDKWEIVYNPLWQPTEQEQATADNVKAQANNTETTMLITLMNNGILAPEEVRKIIVNKYGEYGFDDTLPTTGDDASYSDMVDLQAQVDELAGDENAPPTRGSR